MFSISLIVSSGNGYEEKDLQEMPMKQNWMETAMGRMRGQIFVLEEEVRRARELEADMSARYTQQKCL